MPLHETFPPIHEYRLTAQPAPGSILLSGGEQPVHAHRVRADGLAIGTDEFPAVDDATALRAAWLGALARIPAADVPQECCEVVVEFESDARYVAQAVRERDAMRARIARLRDALVDAGAMTRAEAAGLPIEVGVVVDDRREHPREKLSKLPPPAPPPGVRQRDAPRGSAAQRSPFRVPSIRLARRATLWRWR